MVVKIRGELQGIGTAIVHLEAFTISSDKSFLCETTRTLNFHVGEARYQTLLVNPESMTAKPRVVKKPQLIWEVEFYMKLKRTFSSKLNLLLSSCFANFVEFLAGLCQLLFGYTYYKRSSLLQMTNYVCRSSWTYFIKSFFFFLKEMSSILFYANIGNILCTIWNHLAY